MPLRSQSCSDITPPNNWPIENHIKEALKTKLFLLTGATLSLTITMVIEIIHCGVVLMVTKIGWPLIFCAAGTQRLVSHRLFAVVGDSRRCYLLEYRKKGMVTFCLSHSYANLLWFSCIGTSRNYNQSKFSLICAVFCSVLISALEGPHFPNVKNTAI